MALLSDALSSGPFRHRRRRAWDAWEFASVGSPRLPRAALFTADYVVLAHNHREPVGPASLSLPPRFTITPELTPRGYYYIHDGETAGEISQPR